MKNLPGIFNSLGFGWHGLTAICIVLFTFPALDFQTFSGLDPAYFYALNYFFNQRLVAGQDFIFSYGPLGFLKDPQAAAGLDLVGVVGILILRWVLAGYLLQLSCLHARLPLALGIFLVLLTLAQLQSLDYVLILLAASARMVFGRSGRWIDASVAWATVALGALVKINIGFTALTLTGALVLLETVQNGQWKRFLTELTLLPSFYFIFWFLVYGHWKGALDYVRNSLLLSPDNLHTTHLPTLLDMDAVWAALGLFFLAGLWQARFQRDWMGWSMVPAFFLVFKYSVARCDFSHVVHGFHFLVVAGALWIFSGRGGSAMIAFWGLALMLWRSALHSLPYVPQPVAFPEISLRGFRQSVWNYSQTHQKALDILPDNLRSDTLPGPWLQRLKDAKVDFFPWVTSSVALYGLRYHPRPFMQHGLASGPFFDRLNAGWLLSSKGPDYVIWHGGWDSSGIATLDGRYVGLEHTRTLEALMQGYEVAESDSRIGLLLKRKPFKTTPAIPEPIELKCFDRLACRWNKWVFIPSENKDSRLLGRLSGNVSLSGFLRKWLFKDAVLDVEIQDHLGRIFRHRLALPGAMDRMYIHPYFPEFPILPLGVSVKALRFILVEGVPVLREPFVLELFERETLAVAP